MLQVVDSHAHASMHFAQQRHSERNCTFQQCLRFLCCAFSRKAADEIRSRINTERGTDLEQDNLTTFHALGNRIVRNHSALIGLNPPETILSQAFQRVAIVRSIRIENEEALNETNED